MEEKDNKSFKILMIIIITAFVTCMLTLISIFAIFINGKEIGKYVLVEATEETENISNQLSKYRTVIDKYFFGEVDEEKLQEGAIRGYIKGLNDPYTEYISKKDMQEYLEDTKGNFVGVGIYMSKDNKKDMIMVAATIKDSPAEKAGIKSGDLIKTVDGIKYTSNDFDIISSKIKGETGTTVKFEMIRGEETLNFEIKREKIVLNKVEGKVIENNIGYIKFLHLMKIQVENLKQNMKN